MNDPGDEQPDFDFDFLKAEEEKILSDLDARDEDIILQQENAEEQAAIEEAVNPFAAGLPDPRGVEFDVPAEPSLTEAKRERSLLGRIYAVASGASEDEQTWNTFVRMFSETGLPELKVTIEFSERQQQLVQQGLSILSLLSDNEEITEIAYALHKRIEEALYMAYAAMPQSEIDARREWQENEQRQRFATLLGFSSFEQAREQGLLLVEEDEEE